MTIKFHNLVWNSVSVCGICVCVCVCACIVVVVARTVFVVIGVTLDFIESINVTRKEWALFAKVKKQSKIV